MQFINDDIDQLFRRAAEEYPLNTNSADWSKVQKALQNNNNSKGKKGKFFFLFLLTAALWSANTFVGYIGNQSNNAYTNREKELSSFDHLIKSQASDKTLNKNLNKNHSRDNEKQFYLADKTSPASHPINPGSVATPVHKFTRPKQPMHTAPGTMTETSGITGMDYQPNSNRSFLYQVHERTQAINISLLHPVFFNNILTAKRKINFANDLVTNRKAGKNKLHNKGFYFGLLAGADISNVKLQKTSNIGYSAGVLLGYKIDRWNIESGILWDQKSYYSDGKYFNPKLWPYWSIKNVDGICRMIELPVTIKYSFSSSSKKSLYAISGISSYIMKKESYNYTYQVGQQPPVEGYNTYTNSTINWLSVLNLGLGYRTAIFRSGTLHIEPYAKIPLHGVGIGKLPINSFGINLSFTKPLKK